MTVLLHCSNDVLLLNLDDRILPKFVVFLETIPKVDG
jgi:hypothetical protein